MRGFNRKKLKDDEIRSYFAVVYTKKNIFGKIECVEKFQDEYDAVKFSKKISIKSKSDVLICELKSFLMIKYEQYNPLVFVEQKINVPVK